MNFLTWPLSKPGIAMLAKPSGDDLRQIIALYELGKLKVTIDRRFSFSRIAEAHQRVEQGIEHGKVVLINKFE
jgi:NADPH2:quinone reductase